MTTVHSYKEVKASKPSIQVAVAFMLLLPSSASSAWHSPLWQKTRFPCCSACPWCCRA